MDVEQEFSALMKLLKVGLKGGKVSLEELCKESLQFFDKIQKKAASGTEQETEELMRAMTQLHTTLTGELHGAVSSATFDETKVKELLGGGKGMGEEYQPFIDQMRSRLSGVSEEVVHLLRPRGRRARKQNQEGNDPKRASDADG